jgi:hypothetical protein
MAKTLKRRRPAKNGRQPETDNGVVDYEIGYGKPPVKHRFKPGQSGNRRGRPRDSVNVATAVRNAAKQKRMVTVDGKQSEMTSLDIAVRRQFEKAVNGDTKAFQAVVFLVEAYAPEMLTAPVQKAVDEEGKALLQDYAARNATKPTITQDRET